MSQYLTLGDVLAKVEDVVAETGKQYEAATKLGILPGNLSEILARRRPPTRRLLAALQLEAVTVYRPLQKPEPISRETGGPGAGGDFHHG